MQYYSSYAILEGCCDWDTYIDNHENALVVLFIVRAGTLNTLVAAQF